MLVYTTVDYLAAWYLLPKKTSNFVLYFQIENVILEVQITDHTSDLTRVRFDKWQCIRIVR